MIGKDRTDREEKEGDAGGCPERTTQFAVFAQRLRLRQNSDGTRGAERDSDQRNERLEHHQQLGPSG
jgi:hypothetical protein